MSESVSDEHHYTISSDDANPFGRKNPEIGSKSGYQTQNDNFEENCDFVAVKVLTRKKDEKSEKKGKKDEKRKKKEKNGIFLEFSRNRGSLAAKVR